MLRTIPYILAFIAAIFVFQSANAAVEVGQDAPAITTTDTNGNAFNLADHKGKIVVLEWTNHDCPFVKKHYESGNMQKTQETVLGMGDDIEWISIVSSAEGQQGFVSPEEANKIVEEKGAHITAKLLDASGEIGKAYGAKTTPHMFVIDKDGKIAYMGAIDDKPSPNPSTIEGAENYVIEAVTAVKEGKPVATSSTQPYGCGVKYAF